MNELLEKLCLLCVPEDIPKLLRPLEVYEGLSSEQAVVDVKRALEDGSLSSDDVVLFLCTLCSSFVKGEKFDNDVALAGVLIAAEGHDTPDFLLTNIVETLVEEDRLESPVTNQVALALLARSKIRRSIEEKKIERADKKFAQLPRYDEESYDGLSWLEGRATTDEAKREIVEKILESWKRAPCLRLGQLIVNSVKGDVFYVEDVDLSSAVEEFSRRGTNETS